MNTEKRFRGHCHYFRAATGDTGTCERFDQRV